VSTHLLAPSLEACDAAKVRAAAMWRVPVLGVQWLISSAARGNPMPAELFLLDPGTRTPD